MRFGHLFIKFWAVAALLATERTLLCHIRCTIDGLSDYPELRSPNL
jgi:hypothetical protein